MFSREQLLIAMAGAIVAGLVGGAVVALAVRSDDDARAALPAAPTPALVDPGGRGHLRTEKPVGALLELWSSAQWGDVPRTLALQDPLARRSIGDAAITGVYAHQRSRMVTRKPRVLSTEVRGRIATVRYRLQGEPRSAPPQLAILRRRGADWFMRYDTFVEDALPYYIFSVRGADANPARGDRVAGADVTTRYREQVAEIVRLPSVPAAASGAPSG